MDFGVIFMICTIVFIVVISPLIVPPPWRLMAAIWLAVFQIYLFPIQGLYFSLAFLCAIGLWPEVLKHGKELLKWRITQYYFLLLAVQIISLAWSPDVRYGVRMIIATIPFVFILAATIEVVENGENLIRPLVYGVLAGAVVEAALVIGFRLVPAWDKAFLSSSIASLFINPNTLLNDHRTIKRLSVFLMNPNTAAAYLGITSLLGYAVAIRYRTWWMMPIGLLLTIGVVSTGSKMGLILLGVSYTAGFFMLARPKLDQRGKFAIILITGTAGVLVALNHDWIMQSLGNSWTVRIKVWKFGLISFWDHPLRGFGFGGWNLAIVEYAKQVGLSKAFAPHNTIIGLWSQSGLFAAILGVLFIVEILVLFWRAMNTPQWREFVILTALAMAWFLMHQQIDNWGLLHERHMMPIAALLIGIVYGISRDQLKRNDGV